MSFSEQKSKPNTILIKNAFVINEGQITATNIYIADGKIQHIGNTPEHAERVIDATGKYLMPGIIDDQVHFREPGLTHKADIYTESRAAVAGGTTSFMEMPNVNPPTLTQELLQKKFDIAAQTSLANHSFFMGASNDNLEEVLKTDPKTVCGVKIFMGSSTGNMLVDDKEVLEKLFANVPMLIATHCEDEATVRENMRFFVENFDENTLPPHLHPIIRNTTACRLSSEFAVNLAKKHDTRLHILHISTAEETHLFSNELPLKDKRITSEVCVHHLYFNADDYYKHGNLIKCNPAIKDAVHQNALLEALLDDRLDIIATDHAPHTYQEKTGTYFKAPSGVPLVQHSLNVMLEFYHAKKISLERIVEKMCHAPAICFQVEKRGYIREGYWADLVLLDLDATWQVEKENIYYKCAWSPFEGHTFKGKVEITFVNGNAAYENGVFDESEMGKRLTFER